MHLRHRQLTFRRQGAAILEALICLPVLLVALAGIVALNGAYSAKLEAKAGARRMAWLQADSGECPATSCANGDCGGIEHQIRSEGLDRLLDVSDSRFSLRSFLGNLGRFLLGKATKGVGSAEAASSPIFGRARTAQHGITTLVCNTTSRYTYGLGNVLEQACATGLGTTEYASAVCR